MLTKGVRFPYSQPDVLEENLCGSAIGRSVFVPASPAWGPLGGAPQVLVGGKQLVIELGPREFDFVHFLLGTVLGRP